jgi:naphthoate synthase
MAGLDTFAQTDEAKEGAKAFAEKRRPEFGKYVQSY